MIRLSSGLDTQPDARIDGVFEEPRIFFPGLNQLRMLAAFSVVFHHIEQIKHLYGLSSMWSLFPVCAMGKEGVRLFFVLSGFLITYLLIAESRKHSRISISKFYLRRVLRIWPLYYLIVALAFFVLPNILHAPSFALVQLRALASETHQNFWQKLGLYVCFLPNYCLNYFAPVPGAAQCWSLGVEEQFYLFWPILFAVFRPRGLLIGIALVIGLKYFGAFEIERILGISLVQKNSLLLQQLAAIRDTIYTFDIESLGSGAAAAWMLARSPSGLTRFASHPYWLGATLIIIGVCFVQDFPFRGQLSTVGFSLLVLRFAVLKMPLGKLERPIDHLGRVSYGIYMYHPFVMTAAVQLIAQIAISHFLIGNVLIYSCTLVATALVATLSYKYVEQPFLRLKDTFCVVKSGS